MLPLQIKRVVIKPTLIAAVEFEPAAIEPHEYVIMASHGGNVATNGYGISNIINVGPLAFGKAYRFQVGAIYEDGPSELGPVLEPVSTALLLTNAQVLRQKLLEIVKASLITSAGGDGEPRSLQFYEDKYGKPITIEDEQAFARRAPALEVRLPVTRSSGGPSIVRRIEQLEVTFRIIDTASDRNSAAERAELLCAQVRNAVDMVPSLGLQSIGVVHQSWQWQVEEPVFEQRLVGLEFNLSLQLPNVTVGRLPYN